MGRNKLPSFRKQTVGEVKARKKEWAKSPVVEMPRCPACGSRGTRFPRSHDSMVRYGPNDFRCQECMNVFAVSDPDDYMCQVCRCTEIRDTPAGLMCQQHYYILPNCDAEGCGAVAVDARKSAGNLCREHLCGEYRFDLSTKKREKGGEKRSNRPESRPKKVRGMIKVVSKKDQIAIITPDMSTVYGTSRNKIRHIVYFTEPQYTHLRLLADEKGVRIPEVVRQLVDRSIDEADARLLERRNAQKSQ